MKHGTVGSYNLGCRCGPCTAASTAYKRRWTARARQLPVPDHLHGTIGCYKNWMCRCDACRAAQRAYDEARRRPADRA